MREHNKRWLISKMKTSGSKRDHLVNGRFADERNTKKYSQIEMLPQHESVKKTGEFYNGKINTQLLIRFLRGQIGQDWDSVHSEIISRIPTRLLDYKEIALWYVADKVEFKDGRLWNKRSQKYIWTDGPFQSKRFSERMLADELFEFYVDPETNKLIQIQHKSYKRMSKNDQ
ncbi:MAG TPA: hypothetical protein VIM89_03710 [Mucilaginibacter sp.]